MVGSPAGNVDPAGLSANAVAAGGACTSQTGSDWLSIAGNVATAGVAAVPVVGNCFAAFQDIKHGNYWFAALDVGSILGDEIGAGEGEAEARLAANLAADAEKAKAAESAGVQFGNDANQIAHAFRHVDAAGLDRAAVQNAIRTDLETAEARIAPGQPLNQTIQVGGQNITYTAFKLPNGVVNVGRITVK